MPYLFVYIHFSVSRFIANHLVFDHITAWRYQASYAYTHRHTFLSLCQSLATQLCSCLELCLLYARGCVWFFQCLIYKKLQDTQHRHKLANELLKFHMQVSCHSLSLYCWPSLINVFLFVLLLAAHICFAYMFKISFISAQQ